MTPDESVLVRVETLAGVPSSDATSDDAGRGLAILTFATVA